MNTKSRGQHPVEAAGDRLPVSYDRAPTHTGMIAEKDVAVPMRDGVNLSVDIYRPDDGGKFPVLLAFAIYNKDLQGPDVANSLAAAAGVVVAVGRTARGRRHQILRVTRLCACDRLAARCRQIRRRRLAAMGQLRSDRMDRAAALVRRQCRHGRHLGLRRRATLRRAAKPAASESDFPVRSARRLWNARQLPRGISGRRAASVSLFAHALRRHPRHQGQARRAAGGQGSAVARGDAKSGLPDVSRTSTMC